MVSTCRYRTSVDATVYDCVEEDLIGFHRRVALHPTINHSNSELKLKILKMVPEVCMGFGIVLWNFSFACGNLQEDQSIHSA